MLILTLRICDTFTLTSILILTLNTAKVPPVATLSRTPHCPKLLLLNYGLNRDKVELAVVAEMMLIMMMMTYLSYYSFSAQGWGTQRQIPPDDEFISAEDEMSCQGQGYVWEVICVLCGTVLDQTGDRLGRLAVNLPALLAQDFPTPRTQTEPLFCPSRCPARPPPPISQCLEAANRWLNIWVLSESRGTLWWLCITRHVATFYAQSLLRSEKQPHLQRIQTEYNIIHY